MQYMLLIYTDENAWAGLSEAERGEIFGEYGAFTGAIRESGNFVDGAPLHPTTTATAVRVRDGETLVTDGPFAETKEQLAGFIILELPSVDAALEWAARCPGASIGAVEIRPLAPEAMRRGFTG